MSREPKRYSNKAVKDNPIIFAAFDTETRGLGGELLAISAHVSGETYYFAGPSMIDDFLSLLFQYPSPYVWYAHNAQYDWRYIIPPLIEKRYDVELSLRTETDIYQATIKIGNQKFIMRDSYALIPSKLDSDDPTEFTIASSFTPEFRKLKIDIANFDPTNPEHIEYSKRDSQILATALPRIDTLLRKHFGVGVGHTTAGTAINAWCNSLGESEYYKPTTWDEREQFIRQGYYGGLVFLTRTDKLESLDDLPIAETYDINSSYPSVMVDFGVPHGRIVESRDYLSGLMGIYRVRVKAPDDLVIPILPCRNQKGHMQWRRGVFETVVTNVELIFAANHGYQILEVYEGLVFEETAFPFNSFVERCKTIRKNYKKKPEESLAKLMQNSAYGKFGSKRERLKIFHPETDEEKLGAQPLEQLDYFWAKTELDEEMRCKPEWAVFITAHARLKILQAAYSVGIENVVYGDTDSITVLRGCTDSINIGPEYGQFKLEKSWRSFRAIAPKVYAGILMNGQPSGAVKGVPQKAMQEHGEKWLELLQDGKTQASTQSLASLRVALGKGLEPARTLTRKSTDIKNSANWTCQNDKVQPKMVA